MVNTILARRVNHIVAKGDSPAWPKGSKSRGFSTPGGTAVHGLPRCLPPPVDRTSCRSAPRSILFRSAYLFFLFLLVIVFGLLKERPTAALIESSPKHQIRLPSRGLLFPFYEGLVCPDCGRHHHVKFHTDGTRSVLEWSFPDPDTCEGFKRQVAALVSTEANRDNTDLLQQLFDIDR